MIKAYWWMFKVALSSFIYFALLQWSLCMGCEGNEWLQHPKLIHFIWMDIQSVFTTTIEIAKDLF